MLEADILIDGAQVVVRADPPEVIANGAVAIRGSTIVDVGERDTIRARVTAARTVDAAGTALLPGFVDLHVHTCQQLARGLADDIGVLDWLQRIVSFEASMTEEDVYSSVLAACLEMIRGGTTGFVEGCANPFFMDAVGQAVTDSGLRAILTRSTMEFQEPDWTTPEPFLMDAKANLDGTAKLIRDWNGAANGRISTWASWRQQWNLSDELLVALLRLAREAGVGVAGHLSTRRYGQIKHLDELGVLGPDMIFAHAIRYTDEEVDLIAEHGVKIDHNPAASMHGSYGSAVAGRYPEMLAKGVCVGLGCDGAANGNTLDMLTMVRLAATLHNESRMEPAAIPASTALRMGTENGATACGWSSGTIEAGLTADLVAIDLRQPHLVPAHDLVKTIVHRANAQDVVLTIVDGRILMEHRVVTVIDEERVLADADARAARIATLAGIP